MIAVTTQMALAAGLLEPELGVHELRADGEDPGEHRSEASGSGWRCWSASAPDIGCQPAGMAGRWSFLGPNVGERWRRSRSPPATCGGGLSVDDRAVRRRRRDRRVRHRPDRPAGGLGPRRRDGRRPPDRRVAGLLGARGGPVRQPRPPRARHHRRPRAGRRHLGHRPAVPATGPVDPHARARSAVRALGRRRAHRDPRRGRRRGPDGPRGRDPPVVRPPERRRAAAPAPRPAPDRYPQRRGRRLQPLGPRRREPPHGLEPGRAGSDVAGRAAPQPARPPARLTRDQCQLAARVLGPVGSDHLPIQATLAVG